MRYKCTTHRSWPRYGTLEAWPGLYPPRRARAHGMYFSRLNPEVRAGARELAVHVGTRVLNTQLQFLERVS
jgi:hypothetical protein